MSDCYLLPRAVRLTVRRRDQHHHVTGFAALSASVMRAGIGFHCDQANGLGAEKGQYLILPQLLAERRHVGGIRRVDLEDVSGQIQGKRCLGGTFRQTV